MDPIKETVKKVRLTISRYNMLRRKDRVVVAVSGGPDSVCLVDILYKLRDVLGIELLLAHFDHGLRPDKDEDETRFVESLASSLYLPFKTKKAYPGIASGMGSLEERARHARYRFLEEVQDMFSAQKIAVGHNLDDQAETVLIRLLRGSGTSGLAGIPPNREEKIVRPLIQVTREEIETYLELRGLEYVVDDSNFETRYLRNKIRLELIPQLKKYQPRIVEILGHTAEILRNDDEWLEAEAKGWIKRATETTNDREIQIPLLSYVKLPDVLKSRVIRCALKMTGGGLRRVSVRHIEAIKQIAIGKRPQSRVNLPNGMTAKRVYDKLVFSLVENEDIKRFSYFLDRPGTFWVEALGCFIILKELKKEALPKMGISPWTAFLNMAHLAYPLEIRNFRQGDRFIPLGMSGHKKLKDFFMDLKISSEARAQIPILTCRNEPVWVCGLRIDDRFKITPDTKKVLKVTLKPDSSRSSLAAIKIGVSP